MEPLVRARVARLSLAGGLVVTSVGACVAQVGIQAGSIADGVAVALVSLCFGVPLLLTAASLGRPTRDAVPLPLSLAAAPAAVHWIDVELELSDPELELDVVVVPAGAFDDVVVFAAATEPEDALTHEPPRFDYPSFPTSMFGAPTEVVVAPDEPWVVRDVGVALFGQRAAVGVA